ncbi:MULTISPECIES: hypothetical protein, partial [unclassified Imperialibacter]|uniref:beta strand repeat-containing protein n=1 Tax=unclassified Imperialibacter TaxID=2629706 RepID=UPI0019191778
VFDVAANGGTNTFPTATALAPGTYFIEVTNDLGCVSALKQFSIGNTTPIPTTNTVAGVDNTSCTATPNGQVSSNFVWTGGAISYQWYFGTIASGTAVALVTGANPGNGSVPSDPTLATVTGLSAGTYYVEITDTDGGAGTGCVYRQEVSILTDQPVITIAGSNKNQDNTICDPAADPDGYNGEFEVLTVNKDGVADVLGSYTFDWYTSAGVFIINTAGAINNDFNAGSYRVVAKNTATGCVSSPVPFTIGDNTAKPVLAGNFTITPSLSCDNTNFPNGTIDIDPDGNVANNPAGYTIEWHTGGTATMAVGNVTTDNNNLSDDLIDDVLDNVSPGTYSVKVTNTATGCFRVQQFVVGSGVPASPSLTVAVTQEVTDCNNPDGILTGTPAPKAASEYNWFWFTDDQTTSVTTVGGDVSVEGVASSLPEGLYYVRIQDKETGCVSSLMSKTLTRSSVALVSVTINSAPGDCDSDAGEFEFDITGSSGVVDIRVLKEDGTVMITQTGINVAAVNPDVTVADSDPGATTYFSNAGFINGKYVIEVTDQVTGCVDEQDFFLPYVGAPRLDLAVPVVVSHSTNCQPYDGAAIIAGDNTNGVTGGQGGATGQVSVTLTLVDGEFTGDSHDNYQVFLFPTTVVTQPETEIVLTVDDITGFSVNDNMTINGGTATGEIDAISGLELTIDYTGGDITSILAGNTISDGINTHTITGVTHAGLWSVAEGRPTNIQVLEGTTAFQNQANLGYGDVTAGHDDIENTYVFSGLTAGEYTVMAAQEGALFCLSPSVVFEIEDRFFELYIDESDVADIEITNDTNCNGIAANSNGVINIKQIDRRILDGAGVPTSDGIDDATISTDYTYQWFEGINTSAPALGTTATAAVNNGHQITNIPAGSYTVLITNGTTTTGSADACTATYTFEVQNEPEVIEVIAAPTDNTNCSAPFNGVITITTVEVDGGGAMPWNTTANFSANLYKVGAATPFAGPIFSNGATDQFTALEDGDYEVVVENSLTCESTAFPVTVVDATTLPTLTVSSTTNNTNCTTNNGQITVDLGGAVAGYNYSWFVGDITSTTAFTGTESNPSGTETQISGLSGGTYTLKVTDNSSPDFGCFSFVTETIADDIDNIIDFTFNVVDNPDCTPDNGSVTLTSIDLYNSSTNVASTLTAPGDIIAIDAYTMNVYDASDNSIVDTNVEDAGDNVTIAGLPAGNYLIEILNPATQCFSAQKAFTIDDLSSSPTVDIVEDQKNTICDPTFGALEANGQLTATVTGDADDNYTFQWYNGPTGNVGSSTALSNGVAHNGSTVGIDESGVNTSVISNIQEGNYWVFITDVTTGNLGCTVTGGFTLTANLTPVTLDIANVSTTPATDCANPDNGTISIDLADISGFLGNDMSDYRIIIAGVTTTADDQTYNPGAVDPFIITDLSADTYDLTIIDKTTGCVSVVYQKTVLFAPVEPIIEVTTNSANRFCDTSGGTVGNGAIEIRVQNPLGGYYDPANYTFDWYDLQSGSAGPSSPSSGVGDALPGAGSDERTNLAPGFYTVVVTANDVAANDGLGRGCFDQVIVEVLDNPDVIELNTTIVDVTNVTDCTPDNGQIEVTDVLRNTSSDALGNYTFHLYQSDGVTEIPAASAFNGTAIVSSLSPATYFVEARSTTGSGCSSNLLQVVIEDDAVTPTVAIVQDQANTICDPNFGTLEANGQLTATVTGDADDNYTFQWYKGPTGNVGASTALADAMVINGSTMDIDESGVRTSVLSFVEQGNYWVQVTDITTGNLGCTVTGGFTLTANLTPVTLDVANVVANPATDCTAPANGSIIIDLADISGSGAAITDYTIAINGVNTNLADNAALALSTDPETISNLEPDTYDITITDETTGCVSTTYQVTVGQ